VDDYDVLILGSGPGGQKAATAVAKLGHRAAGVERRDTAGGVSSNTGTILRVPIMSSTQVKPTARTRG
jgi:NAD(P) transhydrogenase